MDELKLIDKLHKIEKLFADTGFAGEKEAASLAIEKIKKQIANLSHQEKIIEFKCTLSDGWSRQLFQALCRRYGLHPFRYKGQKYTTVMVNVPKSFMDETLWPEYEKISDILNDILQEQTKAIIQEYIHGDTSETDVVERPMALPAGQSTSSYA